MGAEVFNFRSKDAVKNRITQGKLPSLSTVGKPNINSVQKKIKSGMKVNW